MLVSLSKWTALGILGVTFAAGSLSGLALRRASGSTPPLAALPGAPPPIQGGVDVPAPPQRPAAPTPAARLVKPNPTPGAWYRVAAGDTLSEVSRAAYGTARRTPDLVRANASVDVNRMPKGTLLYIPKGTEAAPLR